MRVVVPALFIAAPAIQIAQGFTQLHQLQWRGTTTAMLRSSSALSMHIEHVDAVAQVLHSFQLLLAESQNEVCLT
jgi:hypothetical protein